MQNTLWQNLLPNERSYVMTVRILAVCGNGQGSSMIMKMKVDQS